MLELALLEALNTPTALKAAILLRSGMWDDLARMQVDPAGYLDTVTGISKYARDRQSIALFSKRVDLETSFDRDEVAYATWVKTEEHCAVYNHVLSVFWSDLWSDPCLAKHVRILRRARKWIRRTLGGVPDSLQGRFGPGTPAELRGNRPPVVADKLTTPSAVTRSALAVLEHSLDSSGLGRWSTENRPVFTRGNELAFVPKNSRTSRVIAMEPGGNLFCQLGVGGEWKTKLHRIGLGVKRSPAMDLSERIVRGAWDVPDFIDGKLVHMSLACEGSITGEYATDDFESASGCISQALVRLLFDTELAFDPVEQTDVERRKLYWYQLMCSLRSPYTKLPKQYGSHWVRAEAFSTMGNGFTFELLTTCICAIVHGATGLLPGKDFWVFGDDLIVPIDKNEEAVKALVEFGFILNREKSFAEGSFRESCGGDFFCGINVRPKYIRVGLSSMTAVEVVDFHNNYGFWPVTAFGRSLRRNVRKLIPRSLEFHFERNVPWAFHTSYPAEEKTVGGIRYVAGINVVPEKIPADRWGYKHWGDAAQVMHRMHFSYEVAEHRNLVRVGTALVRARGRVRAWVTPRQHATEIERSFFAAS